MNDWYQDLTRDAAGSPLFAASGLPVAPAGFWRRGLAYLVDLLLVYPLERLLLLAVPHLGTTAQLAGESILYPLYFIPLWRTAQGTVGYRLAGMRLRSMDGTLTWGRAIGRFLISYVALLLVGVGAVTLVLDLASLAGHRGAGVIVVTLPVLALGIVGALNFLSMLWDPTKQAWHDRAAHTVVTRAPR